MSGRGGVRSSARLSGDAAAAAVAAGAATATATGGAAPGARPAVRVPLSRGRPVATTAAAALRRARAAERAREVEDSPRVLRDKCRRLARALRNAKHLVVYTGAGISTAADIPDYRGPEGVWTRLQRGETVGRVEVSRARPTFTHMALTALWARGALKFVVSQNCDGLHLRAGLPRRALAELHGDMFAELCAPCRRVYLRAFDTTERTARHQHATRRLCHACGAELRDSIVHFGERGRAAWPLNWAGALRHAARADVVLCLGSSLKVLRRYPRLWRMQSAPRARPALYIVNLQWTPKDSVAALKINARCDAVMQQVARRLRLRVPRYRASRDPVLAHAEPLAEPERHTTRREPLAPAGPADSASSDDWEPESPSASDSDEELPLRRLADRLRGSPAPAPSADDRLRAFQVSLESGEATILLRAEHAPSPPPPGASPPRGPTADLRRFRMARRDPDRRPLTINGRGPALADARPPPPSLPPAIGPIDDAKPTPTPTNGTVGLGSRLRRLLEYEPRIDAGGEIAKRPPPEYAATAPLSDVKAEPKSEPKDEPEAEAKDAKREESSSDSEGGALAAGSLAAAIIRRAVLLCRASLYPGLHTIIAPAREAGAAPPECAWCARHYAARRCLWYGPPREPPPAARAWRRARGRRYLCACCGAGDSPPRAADAPDEGGWYGKGYRKGRRRRR
ncbi:sirtuin 7 [Anticarsia gemmatalis]|uniref:sirtuin 7 n=1 Tax=Anticarsia gemmatalis TaxID=129554 RepID=UPI003F762F8E